MNAIPAASQSSAISDSASTIGATSTTSSSSTSNDQGFAAALTSAGPKSARKPTTNKAQDGDPVGGQLPGTGNISPLPAASVAAAAAAAATAAGNPANSALGGTAAISPAVNNAASRGAVNGGAPIVVASAGAADPTSAGSGIDPQAAAATGMELPQDIALAHPQTRAPNDDSGIAATAAAQAAAQAAPITAVTEDAAAAGALVTQSAVTAQHMSATQIAGARVAALSDGAAAGTDRARPASGAAGKLNSVADATGNATTSGSASADGSATAGANTEAWTANGAWTSTEVATAAAASAAAASAAAANAIPPSDAAAANAAASPSISSDLTKLAAANVSKVARPSGAPVQGLGVLGVRSASATAGSEKAPAESALAGVGTVDKHASKDAVDSSISGASGNAIAGAAPATVNPAGATATPTLKVAAGVETAEFGQGLADRVSWMVDNNLNGAKLQVNPAQLGPIEVRIAVQGGHAQVWLTSHSAVTRDALESSSPKLREMLGAQGFGQVSVDISQRSFQERSTHAQPYDWRPTALDSSVSAVQSSARSLSRTSLGALDAYA